MADWAPSREDRQVTRTYPRAEPGARQRARARRRASRAQVWWHFLRVFPACLLLIGLSGLAGFLCSDYFKVQEVRVHAQNPDLAREVARALSGLPSLKHANTLLPPLREIIGRAESCPRVLRAGLTRDLPRRLRVDIEERRPLFCLLGPRGAVTVDEYGVLLLPVPDPGPQSPRAQVSAPLKYVSGEVLPPDALEAVKACIDGARQSALGLKLQLDLRTRYDYTLRTPGDTLVLLGGPDNLPRKIIAATAVERFLAGRKQHARYIDVRIPNRDPLYAL